MTPKRVAISTIKPTERCLRNGYTIEVERQARRTTFVRVVGGELDGARVQLKRDSKVVVDAD